ncbi:MAG: hypothetical protein K2I92_05935, partial [Muribaculaceae bacterium]|nr:hypothetical protein [Muribaculaceae bacterium]
MKRIFSSLFVLFATFLAVAGNTVMSDIARLREAADSLHSIGRTDSAAMIGERAIKIADSGGDLTQMVGTRSAQGVFLRSLGRIDEALDCYGGALDIITS